MDGKLGKLQAEIIEYIGLNPDTLIQPVKKALKSYYSNVNNNIHSLEKKGYVQKGPLIKSERNIELTSYRLSTKGVAYVMAYSKDYKKIRRTMENYEKNLPNFDLFNSLLDKLSQKTALKILQNAGKGRLIYGENLWLADNIQKFIISAFLDVSTSEMKELIRAVNQIPELKEAANNILKSSKT